ncbi:hypothetical protein KDL45_11680 [bacterium]|nr:hypothetical protein [bacterium]
MQAAVRRELEEYEARLAKDNKKLENVASDEIYQKLLKEIQQIKKANDARSDDILILMDKIETEQIALRKDKAHVDEAKAAIESEARPLKNRLDAIPGEIAKYQAERDKMAEGLDRNMMRKYDGLRAQKKGIAIVRVAGRNCGGCNMALSPMIVNKVQRAEGMESCPNCGRILYWDEEVRTNPGATPPPPATNA